MSEIQKLEQALEHAKALVALLIETKQWEFDGDEANVTNNAHDIVTALESRIRIEERAVDWHLVPTATRNLVFHNID